ncbi:MAG: hypothetical protein N7Q72_01035 [Spiroplasma sp. Tabriz.8]|nr:hypothetical protein [Spiroplasma sp. Tabriz.8]
MLVFFYLLSNISILQIYIYIYIYISIIALLTYLTLIIHVC